MLSRHQSDLEATLRSVQAVPGPRPEFLPDSDAERAMDMVMALAAELVVTRDRLDTVERLLAEKAVLDRDAIETSEINYRDDVVAERLASNDALLARVLRMVHQDIRGMEDQQAETPSLAAE